MKIATRLVAGYSLLIILFLLCTGTALHALWQARDDMENAVNNKIYRYELIQNMRNSARDMAVAVRNIALLNEQNDRRPEWDRMVAQKAIYIQNRDKLTASMSQRKAKVRWKI